MKRFVITTAIAGGVAMIGAGLAGVGASAQASVDASHYALTYDTNYYFVPPQADSLVHWARCMKTSSGTDPVIIRYRINPAGKHSRIRLVKRGIRKLHNATGLHFKYLGKTSYIPHSEASTLTGQQTLQAKEQRDATGAELVVAWAKQGTGSRASNLLQSYEDGVGTIKWSSAPKIPGVSHGSQLRIVEAAVVMKRGVTLRSGFQAGGSVGTLLLHELGHSVGLLHVNDPQQIMNPFLGGQSPAHYASGDRTGLTKVGSAPKCFTTPALKPTNT